MNRLVNQDTQNQAASYSIEELATLPWSADAVLYLPPILQCLSLSWMVLHYSWTIKSLIGPLGVHNLLPLSR